MNYELHYDYVGNDQALLRKVSSENKACFTEVLRMLAILAKKYNLKKIDVLQKTFVRTYDAIKIRTIIAVIAKEKHPVSYLQLERFFGNTNKEGSTLLIHALARYEDWLLDKDYKDELQEIEEIKKTLHDVRNISLLKLNKDLSYTKSWLGNELDMLVADVLDEELAREDFVEKLFQVYKDVYDFRDGMLLEKNNSPSRVRFKILYAYLVYTKFGKDYPMTKIMFDVNAKSHANIVRYIRQHQTGESLSGKMYKEFIKKVTTAFLSLEKKKVSVLG